MIISASKYSKDPNLQADGIALTLPVAFFEDRKMSTAQFKKTFERFMAKEDALWHFRLTNLPTREVAWIYLIFDKQFQYRANFVMYERNKAKAFKDAPDGIIREFPPTNWVIFTGPIVKAPCEMPQKGFQGFRYTLKLF